MRELTVISSDPCPNCNKVTNYSLPTKQVERWKKRRVGQTVASIFPSLTDMQRETLISGVCSDECWDQIMFGGQTDEL